MWFFDERRPEARWSDPRSDGEQDWPLWQFQNSQFKSCWGVDITVPDLADIEWNEIQVVTRPFFQLADLPQFELCSQFKGRGRHPLKGRARRC